MLSPAEEERVRERRKKALAMRLAGVDWQTIADQCGYASAPSACTDLRRAREQSKAQLDETVEEQRDQQVSRLERLLVPAWSKAITGDTKAISVAAKLIDQLCNLKGLKAPTQIQLTQRIEMEITVVSEAVIAAVDSLGLPPSDRLRALEAAQERLTVLSSIGMDEQP